MTAGFDQVGGIRALRTMLDQVVTERLKEQLILGCGMRRGFRAIQQITQHVQDGCTFLVRGSVEHIHGIGIDDRPTVGIAVLLLLRELIVVNGKAIGVVPFLMLCVERFEVGRETLVQPDVCPVPPLHIVTEPMLPQLMGDQVRAGIILIGARIVQRPVGQSGCADILLAPSSDGLLTPLPAILHP